MFIGYYFKNLKIPYDIKEMNGAFCKRLVFWGGDRAPSGEEALRSESLDYIYPEWKGDNLIGLA